MEREEAESILEGIGILEDFNKVWEEESRRTEVLKDIDEDMKKYEEEMSKLSEEEREEGRRKHKELVYNCRDKMDRGEELTEFERDMAETIDYINEYKEGYKKWKKRMPEYPKDKDGKPFENSSGKKNGLKRKTSKAGKVSSAIRTWGSTRGIELNGAEYEELDEDFWRALVNLIREGTPWHLGARVLGVAEDRVEYWIDHGASYIDEDNTGVETFARKVIVKDEILKMEAQMESDALDAINASIKRGNTKTSLDYLERLKDREKRFHDRAEYRQIAKDYGMTEKEYVWCLNVLNGISQAKASEMAGRPKNLNMYHYRMNPKVKEFIAVVKAARRKEIVESVPFSKETAQQAMSYVMGTLLDEMERDDNTKADVLKITKEIRDTAVEMGKATSMYPKDEEKVGTTNIAILAGENTEAVLEMLGRKHNTNALNITQFANDRNQGTNNIEAVEEVGGGESEMIEGGAVTGTEE